MQKPLLRGKKAEESTTTPLSYAFKFLLSAMVILVIFGIMSGTTKIFAGEQGQNTVESFKKFMTQLELVANNTKQNATVLLSIGEEQVLAVFSKMNPIQDTCRRDEKVLRPGQCGNSGICGCIFPEENFNAPYECKKIDNSVQFEVYAEPYDTFNANLGATYSTSLNKAHFLLYGNCDSWLVGKFGLKFVFIQKKGNSIMISDDACQNNGGICEYTIDGKKCSGSRTHQPTLGGCGSEAPNCCK